MPVNPNSNSQPFSGNDGQMYPIRAGVQRAQSIVGAASQSDPTSTAYYGLPSAASASTNPPQAQHYSPPSVNRQQQFPPNAVVMQGIPIDAHRPLYGNPDFASPSPSPAFALPPLRTPALASAPQQQQYNYSPNHQFPAPQRLGGGGSGMGAQLGSPQTPRQQAPQQAQPQTPRQQAPQQAQPQTPRQQAPQQALPQTPRGEQTQPPLVRISLAEVRWFSEMFGLHEEIVKKVFRQVVGDRDAALRECQRLSDKLNSQRAEDEARAATSNNNNYSNNNNNNYGSGSAWDAVERLRQEEIEKERLAAAIAASRAEATAAAARVPPSSALPSARGGGGGGAAAASSSSSSASVSLQYGHMETVMTVLGILGVANPTTHQLRTAIIAFNNAKGNADAATAALIEEGRLFSGGGEGASPLSAPSATSAAASSYGYNTNNNSSSSGGPAFATFDPSQRYGSSAANSSNNNNNNTNYNNTLNANTNTAGYGSNPALTPSQAAANLIALAPLTPFDRLRTAFPFVPSADLNTALDLTDNSVDDATLYLKNVLGYASAASASTAAASASSAAAAVSTAATAIGGGGAHHNHHHDPSSYVLPASSSPSSSAAAAHVPSSAVPLPVPIPPREHNNNNTTSFSSGNTAANGTQQLNNSSAGPTSAPPQATLAPQTQAVVPAAAPPPPPPPKKVVVPAIVLPVADKPLPAIPEGEAEDEGAHYSVPLPPAASPAAPPPPKGLPPPPAKKAPPPPPAAKAPPPCSAADGSPAAAQQGQAAPTPTCTPTPTPQPPAVGGAPKKAPPPPPVGGKKAPPPPPPPGKKGAPPPPPPPGGAAAGKGATTTTSVAASVQQNRTKALFWQKLATDASTFEKSVWAAATATATAAGGGSAEGLDALDADSGNNSEAMAVLSPEERENLQEIFSKKAAPPPTSGTGPSAATAKDGRIEALDPTREKNMSIVLQFMRLPLETIEAAVRSMDHLTLSQDTLSGLLSICPTPDDARRAAPHKALYEADKGTTKLSAPTKFVLMADSIPRFQQRLQCWHATLTFPEEAADLADRIALVRTTLQAALNSERLPSLLGFILEVGNFLNSGTRLNGAKGFKMSDLPTIASLKTADGKNTMLQYLVDLIERKKPDTHALVDELQPLVRAASSAGELAKFDASQLTADLEALKNGAARCGTLLSALQRDADAATTSAANSDAATTSSRAIQLLTAFSADAAPRLADLGQQLAALTDDTMLKVGQYFGEDVSKGGRAVDAQSIVRHLGLFVRDYAYERKRMVERRERRERKAAGLNGKSDNYTSPAPTPRPSGGGGAAAGRASGGVPSQSAVYASPNPASNTSANSLNATLTSSSSPAAMAATSASAALPNSGNGAPPRTYNTDNEAKKDFEDLL